MKRFFGLIVITLIFIHFTSISAQTSETYIVKSGDNLWKIAQKFNTTVGNLQELNNLGGDYLQIGQKLIISSNPDTVKNEQATETPSTDTPIQTENVYEVKAGDNLWMIANHNNTSVNALKTANNLSSDALFIGQQLRIPSERQIINQLETPSRGSMPFSGDRIVQYASQYLGTPYKYGGQSPGGFDCSGFTSYVFSQFQIKLNRTAAAQYNQGTYVTKDELEVGDLVFFAGNKGINHVGIYSGNGQIIHSSSPSSGGVIYSSLMEGYYAQTYVGAKRIR